MKTIFQSIFIGGLLILATCTSEQPASDEKTKDGAKEIQTPPPPKPSLNIKDKKSTTPKSTPPDAKRTLSPKLKPSEVKKTQKKVSKSRKLFKPASLNERAPEVFKVKFETSKGDFIIEVIRFWSPRGADRFYNLTKSGYFTDIAFFRVLEGFVAQFGKHGNPELNRVWRASTIIDDKVEQRNQRGTIVIAKSGLPNSRSVQFFINYRDNFGLDSQGFSPFGRVVEGMSVVDSLYSGYGEGAPQGRGPSQGRLIEEGNKYLKKDFPKLDYIKRSIIQN